MNVLFPIKITSAVLVSATCGGRFPTPAPNHFLFFTVRHSNLHSLRSETAVPTQFMGVKVPASFRKVSLPTNIV